jgi:signal transduction histidine kinase
MSDHLAPPHDEEPPQAPSRRPGRWKGLWPAAAQADRRGWLLRELLVVGLATVAALGSMAIAANGHDEGMELDAVSVLLLALAVAALPFRHRYPVAVLAVAFVTTLGYVSFYAEGPVWIPLVVSLGQVVLLGYRQVAVVTLVGGFLLFPWLGVVLGDEEALPAGHLVALAAWLGFLFTLSEVIRARAERAREAARSQAEALRRRATEERLQIARELHDVVAHNMSLISIQAGVALHLIDQRPEQARESLATIKEASKEALVELRSILGVLRQVDEDAGDDRTGDARADTRARATAGAGDERAVGPDDDARPDDDIGEAAPRSPVPGLHRLGGLIRRARAAGLDVQIDTDVDLEGLPRNVDLAAYRIIQESLTNVARHSNDKAAVVRMRIEDGGLAVDVLDEGTGARRPAAVGSRGSAGPSGSGHGLVGMRERAAAVGGRLDAGPRPGRGFAVRAWLPISETGEHE